MGNKNESMDPAHVPLGWLIMFKLTSKKNMYGGPKGAHDHHIFQFRVHDVTMVAVHISVDFSQ